MTDPTYLEKAIELHLRGKLTDPTGLVCHGVVTGRLDGTGFHIIKWEPDTSPTQEPNNLSPNPLDTQLPPV